MRDLMIDLVKSYKKMTPRDLKELKGYYKDMMKEALINYDNDKMTKYSKLFSAINKEIRARHLGVPVETLCL